jgi:hypothetical protein
LRRIGTALIVTLLATRCDYVVREARIRSGTSPRVSAPPDAREVAPGTYVKTVHVKERGPRVEDLAVFGYAETLNPQDSASAVTSLEEGRRDKIPAGLRAVFSGARVGESRRVWSCEPGTRTGCLVSEYTFYREVEE